MSALATGCLVFTLVGSPMEERQAAVLIDGIQEAGGELARCELRVVVKDPDETPGEALRARAAIVVTLERNTVLDGYPLAERALAAAQVEKSAGPGRNLIFLDPAMLVLKPQPGLLLRAGEGAWGRER